jgi:hypothetical protein
VKVIEIFENEEMILVLKKLVAHHDYTNKGIVHILQSYSLSINLNSLTLEELRSAKPLIVKFEKQ